MAVAFVTKNGGCAGQRPCTASGQTLRRLQAETLRTAVLSSGRGPIAHGTGKAIRPKRPRPSADRAVTEMSRARASLGKPRRALPFSARKRTSRARPAISLRHGSNARRRNKRYTARGRSRDSFPDRSSARDTPALSGRNARSAPDRAPEPAESERKPCKARVPGPGSELRMRPGRAAWRQPVGRTPP